MANRRTPGLDVNETVDVAAVQVPVVVTDAHGRFVRGLKKESFTLLENGKRQRIETLTDDSLPLELIAAVDISGSMERAMPQVQAAVKGLLARLRPGDTTTLLGFNETVFVLAERESDADLRAAAVEALVPWGGTAFFDATVRALELVSQKAGRRGIIIFSDGDDRHSVGRRDESLRRIEEGAGRDLHGRVRRRRVGAVPRDAEGLCRSQRRPRLLPAPDRGSRRRVRAILDELSHQYILSYVSGAPPDGSWRTLEIQRLRRLPGAGEGGLSCRGAVIDGDGSWCSPRRSSLAVTGLLAQTPALPPPAPPSPAQPQAPEMPTPRFRAEADVVVVEATVLDRKGAIVRDLGPADFKVEIGGKPRDVVSADLVEYAPPSSDASTAAADPEITTNEPKENGRIVLLIIDQASLASDARAVIDSARRWVLSMPAKDLIGLLTFPVAGAERRLHGRPRQGRRGADPRRRHRPAIAALPAIQHQRLGGDPDGRPGHVRPRRRRRPRMPGQPAALSDRDRGAGQDDAARRAVADPARPELAAGDHAGPGQGAGAEARGAALVRLGDERARCVDRDGLGGGRCGPRQRHHPHLHRRDVGPRRVRGRGPRCDRSRTATC